MFYTYLLKSKKDKRWYTGCTDDLRKRFKRHNDGDVPATKGRGPFELIYYEACLNKDDAYSRERYLKSGPGKRYLNNRLKRFLFLTGLTALLFTHSHFADAGLIVQAPTYVGLGGGLVGYWSFNAPDMADLTAFDRSGNGNNGTLTNGPARVAGKIGQALQFHGPAGADYVSLPSMTIIGDKSVSAWIKLQQLNKRNIIYGINSGYVFFIENTNLLSIYAGGGIASMGSALSANQWYFVTVTTSSTTPHTHSLYVDGQLIGTTQSVGSNNIVGSYRIGDQNYDSTEFFNGLIDDVRIYNRALSPDEIHRLYKIGGTFTTKAPTRDGLVGYWRFDEGAGTIAGDGSGNGNTGTLTNGPTWVNGRVGKALSFDGVDDYVDAGNSGTFEFTSKLATFSAWTYVSNTTHQMFLYHGLGCVDFANWILSIGGDETNPAAAVGRYAFGNGAPGGSTQNVYSTGSAITGTWVHLAGVSDGATLYLYINGVLNNSASASDPVTPNGLDLYIGADPGCGIRTPVNGKIDEVRIYNRALSADEIKTLYDSSKQVYVNVSPRNQLTNGLVGYWTFDGPDMAGDTAYDRSGQGNNGTLTNGPARVAGKIGQALSFDGVDDYVDLGTNVMTTSQANAHTAALWFKFRSCPSGYCTLVAQAVSGDDNYLYFLIDSGNGLLWNWGKSNATLPATWNDGNWHHVAYVHLAGGAASSDMFYFDGSPLPTVTGTGLWGLTSTDWRIGDNSDLTPQHTTNGLIDEVRIYNRALSADEVKRLYLMGK